MSMNNLILEKKKNLRRPHRSDPRRQAQRAADEALSRIASPRMRTIVTVQSRILTAARKFLIERGFIEFISPIISLETDPGIRAAKPVAVEMYGSTVFLNTSINIQKFAAVASLGKVFSFSPSIREEPSSFVSTHRHLAEFRIIELEVKDLNLDGLLMLCEDFVCHVLAEIRRNCSSELTVLGRQLSVPKRPFRRLTFSQARSLLEELGRPTGDTEELPLDAEEILSRELNEWFWLTHLPNGTRGFYDRVDPRDPRYLLDMDLIFPEGYGEACSGGEREHTKAGIVRQMKRTGCDPARYPRLTKLASHSMVPSAGCGFGIERITRFVCGLDSIWDAIPFPKTPGGWFSP